MRGALVIAALLVGCSQEDEPKFEKLPAEFKAEAEKIAAGLADEASKTAKDQAGAVKRVDMASITTKLAIAKTPDKILLGKDEKLHTPRIEFPGVPVYPNAVSLAMAGIGPTIELGTGTTAFYSVTASALDVANFYREQLVGWSEAFEGMSEVTHKTSQGILIYTKGDDEIRVAYQDGRSVATHITGPRMMIMKARR